MLGSFEQAILSALQIIFDKFGWLGVFGLMIFENATGISPAEIILAFAGWMLIERHDVPVSFIPIAGFYAGLGSAIGASITYWVARRNGRPFVDRMVKIFRVPPGYIEKAEEQCRKWGAGIVLIGRFLPGLRVLVNIPAGLVSIPFPKFFIATFIGAYIWCTALIGAGYVFGHQWHLISEYIKTHVPLVLIVGLLLVGAYLAYRYRESLPVAAWMRRGNKELDP
jgi:membrane protein DedA with SNARE-associated domain